MKRLLLLFLIFGSMISASAQHKEYCGVWNVIYACDGIETSYCIELALGSTCYILRQHVESCSYIDCVDGFVILSSGQYHGLDDGSLVLYDKLNGFDMLLRAEGEKGFILEKGFSGIVPLRLTYHRDHAEFSSLPEMDFDSVRDQRERYRSQTELRDFRYGLYEIVHPSVFLLQVSEDTTYRYFVNEIVVSEGVWECQGNLVVFHDSCLGEAFSALVEDGYLVGSCFPGEFGAGKFRIIPKEEYDDIPFPLTPNKDYNPKIIHDCPKINLGFFSGRRNPPRNFCIAKRILWNITDVGEKIYRVFVANLTILVN